MKLAITEQDFLRDVREHRMEILRNDGLYRHVRFARPRTYEMSFDLITWPGYLAYTGDMGSYTFSRLDDMFEFFRSSGVREGTLAINLGYWEEKVTAQDAHSGIRQFEPDAFREAVLWQIKSDRWRLRELPRALRREVFNQLRWVWNKADESEHSAYQAVYDFECHGYRFPQFSSSDCEEYTARFIWCCYALVWGIEQYDMAMQTGRAA